MGGSERNLEQVLTDVAEAAIFKTWDGRSVSPATIRQWQDTKRDPMYEGLGVVPSLPEHLLSKLAANLESLLCPHMVEGEIGNGIALFLGGPLTTSTNTLTGPVARASVILGPNRVAQLLRHWSSGGTIPYQKHIVLSGATVADPFDIGPGILIDRLPDNALDAGDRLPRIARMLFGELEFPNATILTIECEAGPAFGQPDEIWKNHSRTSPIGAVWAGSPERFAQALSLVADHPIFCLLEWSECRDAEAFGFTSSGISSTRRMVSRGGASITKDLIEEAFDLHLRYFNDWTMDPNVGIAITRWELSKEEKGLVDQLVDLRIALETLFGEGIQQEIRFRLAVRGAWFLGIEFEDRKRIYGELRDVYDRASRAIHSGEVRGSDPHQIRALVSQGQELCRAAILKRLGGDDVDDWDDLILGRRQ